MTNTKSGHTILCTWEIGSELGHISRLSAIVRKLESQNYNVVVVLKDLSRAYPFFSDTDVILMQAPVWLPQISMQRPIACLADSLLLLGYLETDALHSLVRAWESIIDLVKPDLMLFDYSPTAMLASQNFSAPKLLVGNGFADPAPGYPIADWRPYSSNDQLIQRQEERVLVQINNVLSRKNISPLTRLSDLFSVDKTLISTFSELDLYKGLRKQAEYCVGSSSVLVDKKIQFPDSKKLKIVAYLKSAYPQLPLLIEALSKCDGSIFIGCPQGDPQQFQQYVCEDFQFSTDLVDLECAMTEADLFVGHGNAATVKESLVAGTPVLVLPIQLEQLLSGKLVQENGYGRLVEKIESVDDLVVVLNEMLKGKDEYANQLSELLSRHPESGRVSISDSVATQVQLLLLDDKKI
ncbi:MAG: glycosyltransferase [Cellvibrionaceae bacterium]